MPIDKVVRHYDASRKMCPQSMSANNCQKWLNFKNRISSGTSNQVANSNVIYGTVTASVLNVRSGAGTNCNVIGQLKNGQKVRLDKKVGSWWSIYFEDSYKELTTLIFFVIAAFGIFNDPTNKGSF